MHISKVSLVNYRNFANAKFLFNEGINTIIGENGAGKTNVFRAIRLLLDDAFIQFAYKLDKGDFNRSIGDCRGHWIIISIEFDDISQDEAVQSLFIHGAGMVEGDFVTKASYNLFFRPKADIRLKLSQLDEGDTEGLEEIIEGINIEENYETYFTGKSIADFNDPAVYKDLVGDFKNVKFNFEIDQSLYGIKIPHQLSVAKEVSFTFIKALRDVVSDFHSNRKNPLLTLLKNKSGERKNADYDPITKLVKELNEGIEGLPDVVKIRDDIKITINDAVGYSYSPSSLSIKSSLSSEADKLLQSLKLYIGEPGEDYEGGINELSLGGANLIFLTLKLLEYKYRKSKDTFANFLIIEEPEAHIHTHIQKTLFDRLNYGDTQIIYSTHSTHISDVSNVENMNILAKKEGYAEVYHPAVGLSDTTAIQRYLDAIRSNLLFAKGVILVEGDAEELLIPVMVKEVLGVSLDELGISLINIRSTGFENVAQLFNDKRIRRKCSILTDLDTAICNTVILATDKDADKKYKRKVESSAKSGKERKEKLDIFISGNDWVDTFYADNTFEVDFVKAGNEREVEQLVGKVYSKPKTIAIAIEDLNSEDVSRYGKRVLTMAKQEGKGWFAIMLGGHVSYETYIPDYVFEAIAFAKQDFDVNTISNIVKFRIEKMQEEKFYAGVNFSPIIDKLKEFVSCKSGLKEVIEELEKVTEDQLITFLKLL